MFLSILQDFLYLRCYYIDKSMFTLLFFVVLIRILIVFYISEGKSIFLCISFFFFTDFTIVTFVVFERGGIY